MPGRETWQCAESYLLRRCWPPWCLVLLAPPSWSPLLVLPSGPPSWSVQPPGPPGSPRCSPLGSPSGSPLASPPGSTLAPRLAPPPWLPSSGSRSPGSPLAAPRALTSGPTPGFPLWVPTPGFPHCVLPPWVLSPLGPPPGWSTANGARVKVTIIAGRSNAWAS